MRPPTELPQCSRRRDSRLSRLMATRDTAATCWCERPSEELLDRRGVRAKVDVLHQPGVTILQGLRIVQVVSRVIIQHLFGLASRLGIVFHGCLIEVLL